MAPDLVMGAVLSMVKTFRQKIPITAEDFGGKHIFALYDPSRRKTDCVIANEEFVKWLYDKVQQGDGDKRYMAVLKL